MGNSDTETGGARSVQRIPFWRKPNFCFLILVALSSVLVWSLLAADRAVTLKAEEKQRAEPFELLATYKSGEADWDAQSVDWGELENPNDYQVVPLGFLLHPNLRAGLRT